MLSALRMIIGTFLVLNQELANVEGKGLKQETVVFVYEQRNSSDLTFERLKPIYKALEQQEVRIVRANVGQASISSRSSVPSRIIGRGKTKELSCRLDTVLQVLSKVNPDVIVCLAQQYSLPHLILTGREKGLLPGPSRIYTIFGRPTWTADSIKPETVDTIMQVVNLSDRTAVVTSKTFALLQSVLEKRFGQEPAGIFLPTCVFDENRSGCVDKLFKRKENTHDRVRRDVGQNAVTPTESSVIPSAVGNGSQLKVISTPVESATQPMAIPSTAGSVTEPSTFPSPTGNGTQPSVIPSPTRIVTEPSVVASPTESVIQPSVFPSPTGSVTQPSTFPSPTGNRTQPSVIPSPTRIGTVTQLSVISTQEKNTIQSSVFLCIDPSRMESIIQTPVANVTPFPTPVANATKSSDILCFTPAPLSSIVATPVQNANQSSVISTPVESGTKPVGIPSPTGTVTQPSVNPTLVANTIQSSVFLCVNPSRMESVNLTPMANVTQFQTQMANATQSSVILCFSPAPLSSIVVIPVQNATQSSAIPTSVASASQPYLTPQVQNATQSGAVPTPVASASQPYLTLQVQNATQSGAVPTPVTSASQSYLTPQVQNATHASAVATPVASASQPYLTPQVQNATLASLIPSPVESATQSSVISAPVGNETQTSAVPELSVTSQPVYSPGVLLSSLAAITTTTLHSPSTTRVAAVSHVTKIITPSVSPVSTVAYAPMTSSVQPVKLSSSFQVVVGMSTVTFVLPSSTLPSSSVLPTPVPLQNETYEVEMQGECVANFEKCQFATLLEKAVSAVVNKTNMDTVTVEIADCNNGLVKVKFSVLNVQDNAASRRLQASYREIKFVFENQNFAARSSPERVEYVETPLNCDVTFKMSLKGDCNVVTENESSKKEFIRVFKMHAAIVLSIEQNNIIIKAVTCGSVDVTFTVKDGKRTNITEKVHEAAKDQSLKVNYRGNSFIAERVEIVVPDKPTEQPQTQTKHKLSFILYVTFGALMGVIFLIGLCVLLVRCHRDRNAGGFNLGPDAELELSGFNRIPRANYYQVDFYGGAEEIDASRGETAEGEFEGGIVPISQSTFPTTSANGGAHKKGSKRATGGSAVHGGERNQDEFAMGHLPDWDLPKLAKEDVTVAPSEDKVTLGTTFGSKENLIEDQKDGTSSSGDASHAYDNPALSVSELERSPDDEEGRNTTE